MAPQRAAPVQAPQQGGGEGSSSSSSLCLFYTNGHDVRRRKHDADSANDETTTLIYPLIVVRCSQRQRNRAILCDIRIPRHSHQPLPSTMSVGMESKL